MLTYLVNFLKGFSFNSLQDIQTLQTQVPEVSSQSIFDTEDIEGSQITLVDSKLFNRESVK